MPREIPVQCPSCQLRFEVDLDDYDVLREFYADGETAADEVAQDTRQVEKTKVEEYRILCPRCGAYFIVPVTIEEVSDEEANAG